MRVLKKSLFSSLAIALLMFPTSFFEIYLLFSYDYLDFHFLKLRRRIVAYVGNSKRYSSPVVNL